MLINKLKLILFLFISGVFNNIQASSPNFILILADDQGWNGTSVKMDPAIEGSKSDYHVTPALEKLAAMSMLFTNGYSPGPFCCPTRRSLQIGQSPARHIYQEDQEGWTSYYKEQPNICQTLKSINKEYKTAHFGKWDFRFDEITPSDMRFDESDGYTDNGIGGSKSSVVKVLEPQASDDPKLIGHVTNRAIEFMEKCQYESKPFFVQLSHYAVHLEMMYKQETLDKVNNRQKGTRHDIAPFAAMTEDLDDGLGKLLSKVEKLGLMDNTYIIYLSDNGGKHYFKGFDADNVNRPLREGKSTMYEGGIRVPFMIAGPGIKNASVSEVPVSGVDILPTLADLAGGNIMHERLDGGSLKNLLLGKKKSQVKRNNEFFVFHHAIKRRPQSAIREGNLKLVKTYARREGEKDLVELFDLEQDISESNNLAEKFPEKVSELGNKLANYLTEVGSTTTFTKKPKKKK